MKFNDEGREGEGIKKNEKHEMNEIIIVV